MLLAVFTFFIVVSEGIHVSDLKTITFGVLDLNEVRCEDEVKPSVIL